MNPMATTRFKTLVVIAGATATGKSDLACDLARHLNTEIISADSRQCYRELNIGVAKPDASMLSRVKHHFIDSHSIHELVSAADYEIYALNAAEKIFEKNNIAVVAGGTGLYINALLYGFDEIPATLPGLRQELTDKYKAYGMQWLLNTLSTEDPLFFSKGETQNPQRMIRALEVMRSTGRSIIQFKTNNRRSRPFNILKYQLVLPREELYRRINARVDRMIEQGLVEEVRSLIAYKHHNALQTVGYKELFMHFDGSISLETAIKEIKKNTRHYAKRQMTWFNKDVEMEVVKPAEAAVLLKTLSQQWR